MFSLNLLYKLENNGIISKGDDDMLIAFEQVGKLLIFIAIGYILGHFNIVDKSHSKILSILLVYFITPCTSIKSLSSGFTVEYIKSYYPMIIASLVLLAAFIIIAIFVSKLFTKNRYEQNVYHYTLTVPNYGYMGYALAEGLFGAMGLLNMVVYCLFISIYIGTVGYIMLTNQKFSYKLLIKPPVMALIIGIFLGLTQIPMPSLINDIVNTSAACLSPIAMLLTGIVISEFKFKDLITDKKAYIVSALRLIVIPLLVLLVMKPFFNPDIVTTAVLYHALPCGLNTIVYAKSANENYILGAKFAVISSVLSLITLPLILFII